ncbi:MAG: hypothetical protein FWH12_05950 [Treponema sp.]|nr:hypothetical protein [Treponema sp.]
MTKEREQELNALERPWTKDELKEWAKAHPNAAKEWGSRMRQLMEEARKARESQDSQA